MGKVLSLYFVFFVVRLQQKLVFSGGSTKKYSGLLEQCPKWLRGFPAKKVDGLISVLRVRVPLAPPLSGCSLTAKLQPSKLTMRVRLPSLAPFIFLCLHLYGLICSLKIFVFLCQSLWINEWKSWMIYSFSEWFAKLPIGWV